MSAPEITCVIPTYNDRVHVPRAVQSALTQHGVDVEVLLVDDRSDEPTRDFLRGLAGSDPRIRLFEMPDNGGQSRSRNVGAVLARGRYVTFLDQDDEHAPGWYRDGIDYMRAHPGMGALSGLARVDGLPARLGIDGSDPRVQGLTFILMNNVIFLRSVFMATGGFPVGPIWRTRAAGEDGCFRHAVYRDWNLVQCDRLALVHHAREGGATVHYLDRTELRDGHIVMTHAEEAEKTGELDRAQQEFWARAMEIAAELRGALRPGPIDVNRR